VLVVTRAPAKISRSVIEAAWKQRKSDQRLIVRDKDCRGLALIVNAASMVWSYSYRPRGIDPHTGKRWPNRTITIGTPASHTPDAARDAVNRIKGQVHSGQDPVVQKKAKAAAEQRKQGLVLERLLEEYRRALPQRQRMRGHGRLSGPYLAVEVRQVGLALAAMGAEKKLAPELTDADVRKLVTSTSGEGGNSRGRFGALNRFLDWCQDEGHIAVNRCSLLARNRRPRASKQRTHYLELDDLARLWRRADRLPEPVWRDFSRFLMAIPCRRGEAASLNWSHLNLGTAEWRQPDRLTKNGDPHRFYLHALALDILRRRHEAAGKPREGLVFPAPRSRGVLLTFGALKTMLTDPSEVPNWTWHDFRRSFATALGEAGIPEVVADAILNHRQSATRGGVLGVYQRASRWPEQVKAMKLWGELLAAAIEGQPTGAG
jgi:integrase